LALDPLELSALARELNGDDESLSGIESATFLANGWMAGARALLLSKTGSERELQVVPTVLERYFEEKICGALRPEQSQKLMELSTLSTFSATLLAELPEAPIGWDEFELLRNDGIYFERLDTDWSDEFESWYRVQPLLAEYLVLRHRRTNAGRVAALHQFAAEWFEKRGLPDEAVRHALRCKDTEFSTALLERAGALGVGLRQGVALFRATGGLARLSNVRHPLLGLGQVYQDVQEGRVAEARAMFEALRESTCSFQNWGDSNSSPETSRLAALLESILEKYEDRPRSSEALRRLQQHVDAQDGDPIVRATHASLLALAYLGNGLFHEAQTICEIGLGAVRHLRARHVHFCLRVQQTHAAIALGRLQEAALHVERARELAIAAPGGWPQGIAIADVLRGVLHFESNEIEEAEKLLWRALPREPIFTPWFEIYALGFTAKVAIASMKQGATGALEVLADLESLSSRCRIPRLAQLALVLRLRESVRVGNLALAIELSRDERLMALTNGTNDCADIWDLRLRTPALIEVGRLLASLGRTRDAMELLGRINRRHVHEGDARERFGYLALFASVALKLERAEEAFESFGSALDLALQARFTRRILDHRSDLLGVFERAVSDGRPLSARCARFCTSVLRNANDAETCLALERKLLAESRPLRPNEFGLTSRENEVLGFVAEGLSSKEIAYRLSVSESTVKTHRKKVYMKLGVGRRSQAIAKARAKGLA
jgi:ATP/maltotriose-dependent transcriptional regulator MalT